MFGSKLEWGSDRNVLNNEVKLFEGGFIADQFMKTQGYAKGERVVIQDTRVESVVDNDGTGPGVRTLDFSNKVQLGESQTTFVTPDKIGKQYNKLYQEDSTPDRTVYTNTYTTVKSYSEPIQQSIFSSVQTANDLSTIIKSIIGLLIK